MIKTDINQDFILDSIVEKKYGIFFHGVTESNGFTPIEFFTGT
jgi:hypothetical protein